MNQAKLVAETRWFCVTAVTVGDSCRHLDWADVYGYERGLQM